MNPQEDPERISPSSGGDLNIAISRKERGAIAAQACETCRTRKQKCDEKRPRCSTCNKFGLACNYREPQPTKKDRTLAEILEHIRLVEKRFDTLEDKIDAFRPSSSVHTGLASPNAQFGHSDPTRHGATDIGFNTKGLVRPQQGSGRVYRYESATHQVLGWLSHRRLRIDPRASLYLSATSNDGSGRATALGLHKDGSSASPGSPQPAPVVPPARTPPLMAREVAAAYMGTVNLVCPILDGQSVNVVLSAPEDSETMAPLQRRILALGHAAVDIVQGGHELSTSGALGHVLATETSRFTDYLAGRCTMEAIQALILTASCSALLNDHQTAWRLHATALANCEVLRQLFPNVMASSSQARLLRRCAWQSAMSETYFNLELDLPLPDVIGLMKDIGLPDEADTIDADDLAGRLYHDLFLHQAKLLVLTVQAHNGLKQAFDKPGLPTDGDMTALTDSLAGSLRKFHESLPAHLAWPSEDPFANQPHPSLGYPATVLTALFRTRYNYAVHLVYRPFLYRAVSALPQTLPNAVVDGVTSCLVSCLRWPVAYLGQIIGSPTVSPTRTTPPSARLANSEQPRAFFDPIRQANVAPRSSPPSLGGPSIPAQFPPSSASSTPTPKRSQGTLSHAEFPFQSRRRILARDAHAPRGPDGAVYVAAFRGHNADTAGAVRGRIFSC